MENTNYEQPSRISRLRAGLKSAILKRPFTFFIVTLLILVALIGIANTINKPKIETKTEEKPAKEVSVFSIGTSPKITTQATIRKSGTISIYAQTAGVVQKVYKKEGDTVSKGTNIAWISNTYSGGTISTAQRQIAQKNYESTQTNYPLNIETVNKQRELAEQNRENTEQLRQISEKSAQESNDLINLNNEMYQNVVTAIETIEQNSTPSATESAQLTQLKGQQAQLSGAINQLRAGVRANEYQGDTDNPPTQLADIQHDLTLKQLDLQERNLTLQLEISKLNYQVAQISEGLNYPSSPITGKVERINVIFGQTVSPGELLAVISTDNTSAVADSFVSAETAKKISKLDPSLLYLGNTTVEATPAYISSQPTNGQLYSVTYQIPSEHADKVNNQGYIKIEIPIGLPDTAASAPFVPIDAIYQTQDGAFVYVVDKKDNKEIAKGKKVQLGTITGSYVEITSGLTKDEKIITDRNILEGDYIKVK